MSRLQANRPRTVTQVDANGNPNLAYTPLFVGQTSTGMGASWASDAIDVGSWMVFAISAAWTGGASPSGTMRLEASNDNVNWSEITTLSGDKITVNVSGAGSAMWDVIGGMRYVRLAYTASSGGGSDSCTAKAWFKR